MSYLMSYGTILRSGRSMSAGVKHLLPVLVTCTLGYSSSAFVARTNLVMGNPGGGGGGGGSAFQEGRGASIRGSFIRPAQLGRQMSGSKRSISSVSMPSSTSAAAMSQRNMGTPGQPRRESLSEPSNSMGSEETYFDETWGPVLRRPRGDQRGGDGAADGGPAGRPRSASVDDLEALNSIVMHDDSDFEESESAPRGTGARGIDKAWVTVAHRMADSAGVVLRAHFRKPLKGDINKADGSPVSEADKQSEAAMRAVIEQAVESGELPEAGVLGEEMGLTPAASGSQSRFTWVLDPIDGTKSFMAGKPTFGVLIALLRDGVPVMGIIDQPITRERWVGVEGRQTTLNGEVCQTDQSTERLQDTIMFCTSPTMFEGCEESIKAFKRLEEHTRFTIGSSDCYGYGLVASGYGGLACEANLQPYDYLALVPIIEGAGGWVRDWEGNRLKLGYTGDKVLAAGNAVLANKALKLLSGK